MHPSNYRANMTKTRAYIFSQNIKRFGSPPVYIDMKTLIRVWEKGNVPPNRRVSLLRRCHLDAQIQNAQRRLTQKDVAILDFRLGVSDGHAHTLKETAGQFGLPLAQVRRVEAKLFGVKIATISNRRLKAIIRKCFADPDWAKKVLAECYEE